jgi:hypothetical protein
MEARKGECGIKKIAEEQLLKLLRTLHAVAPTD